MLPRESAVLLLRIIHMLACTLWFVYPHKLLLCLRYVMSCDYRYQASTFFAIFGVRLRRFFYQCYASTVFSLYKCLDKPTSGIKPQTVCLWAQLIYNWKHKLVAPFLTHISPINSQFCITRRDSFFCTQDIKLAHSKRGQPNPTDGRTTTYKAQHILIVLGLT